MEFNSLLSGTFSPTLLSSADFFKINLSEKILSGIPSECQTVWIQIRPDILSGLIWVQSVCKGYQQTTQGGKKFNWETLMTSRRPQDKSGWLKIIFLISQPKHMLWVLKRTISMRQFFWEPTTNVLVEKIRKWSQFYANYFCITGPMLEYWKDIKF